MPPRSRLESLLVGTVAIIVLQVGIARLWGEEKPSAGPLQGAWKLVSVEAEGGTVDLPEPLPAMVVDKTRLMYAGEEIASLKADAEGELKGVDLAFAKSKRTFEGVYVLEKESLTICLNGQSDGLKERPTSLKLEGHPKWRLLKFEKIKPEDAPLGNGFVAMALRNDKDLNALVIQSVLEDSPAKEAGLQKEDQIVRIDGAVASDLMQTVAAIRKAKPRSELPIVILRDGKELEIKVKVAVFPLPLLLGLE